MRAICSGAALLARAFDVPWDTIAQAVASFRGVAVVEVWSKAKSLPSTTSPTIRPRSRRRSRGGQSRATDGASGRSSIRARIRVGGACFALRIRRPRCARRHRCSGSLHRPDQLDENERFSRKTPSRGEPLRWSSARARGLRCGEPARAGGGGPPGDPGRRVLEKEVPFGGVVWRVSPRVLRARS